MSASPIFSSLLCQDAPQLNQDLMVQLQAALDSNPAADVLSIINDKYHREHRKAQSAELSELGRLNVKTLSELYWAFEWDPEIDLASALPRNYSRRRGFATPSKTTQQKQEECREIADSTPDFRVKLDDVETARVVFPVSARVRSLLVGDQMTPSSEVEGNHLVDGLKRLIWNSPKLWESPVRGVVVKCSDGIAAKIVCGNSNYTEYTTLQYLEQTAPDIPAPRPHGLIAFGPYRVVFMSFVSGITLSQAWPKLSFQQESSIQQQLDGIFTRLRSITKPQRQILGGVCGEGVKAFHIDACASFPTSW